ncbi:hypothetical protein BH11PLA2_BH11PLA2_32090 [soil metagenome]
MEQALRMLMEVLPPPRDPTGREVNWREHETALGITYPTWLKEFIAVYGGSIWFDNYSILYPALDCYDIASFRQAVYEQLNLLVTYGVTDEDFNPIKVSLYPEPSGLFPFMVDYDGMYYFWKMEPADPDRWPLMRWENDTLRTLKYATLADMFLDRIEDYKRIQPNRVRVDRWVPPASAKV